MNPSHHASASTSSGIWTGSLTDVRHTFRLLWKSKGITATTLVTLALGIGATTAIFSSVYSLMLKPLPFQEPERIVELYSSAVKAGLNRMPANVPFYLDYSANATSYEKLGLWTFFYGLVGEKDAVVRLPGVRMTAELFDILRIQPVQRHLLHKGAEPTGGRQGHRAHAILLADAVPGESGSPGQGSADRRRSVQGDRRGAAGVGSL